jgi:hypothetical protein
MAFPHPSFMIGFATFSASWPFANITTPDFLAGSAITKALIKAIDIRGTPPCFIKPGTAFFSREITSRVGRTEGTCACNLGVPVAPVATATNARTTPTP